MSTTEEMAFTIDQESYEAILEGNLEFFEGLVNHFQGTVRAFVTSRMNDPVEAYDLTQEVFLIAFRRWKDFDYERPLKPWLLGIAVKLVYRHHEKKRAIPVGAEDEVRAMIEEQVEETPEIWQDAPLMDALELCLERLENHAQSLVRQRYFEERSISEIREALGLKHAAVTMKLHRIRKKLQECIEGKLEVTPS